MPEPKPPKMWKMNVEDYSFKPPQPVKDEKGEIIDEITFQVKKSFREVLFNPDQRLNLIDAFANKELADRIEKASKEILLNDKEVNALKRAFDSITSPREHELEFYRRIQDIKEVEVEEKRKK